MARGTPLSIATAIVIVAGTLLLPLTGGATVPTESDDTIAGAEGVSIDVDVNWDSDQPDHVQYSYTFEASRESDFTLDIDEEISDIEGFSKTADGDWQYDESAQTHRVVIRQSVPAAATQHDWVYSAQSGVFVPPPNLRLEWRSGESSEAANPLWADYTNVDISYGNHSGFRKWQRIYVGAYRTYTTTQHNQSYTIYRPVLAQGAPYKQAIRSMVAVDDRVPMFDSPTSADVIVFPAGAGENDTVSTYRGSDWSGTTYGPSEGDALVMSDQNVDDYHNTWAHEYVHLEQGYGDGPETEWILEGQAKYFTAMTMYEAGCGDGNFEAYLAAEDGTKHDVLSDETTWSRNTPYEKGLAIFADFGARLVSQTDGQTTLTDVFAHMEDSRVDTHEAFVSQVNATVGDSSLNEQNKNYLDKYVTTSDYPGNSTIDHPPMDRATSCLAEYQYVTVTVTHHEDSQSTLVTNSDTPASPTPTATPTSTPDERSTSTPTATPGGDGNDGSLIDEVVDAIPF